MDYTAVLSRLEIFFSGNGGVFLIAALGVLAIFGAHFMRMRSSTTSDKNRLKSKSYRHVVITPYDEKAGGDPVDAITPRFSAEAE